MKRQRASLTTIVIGIIFSVIMIVAGAQPASSEERPEPRLAVENPVYDFGTVIQGAKVSHDFTIKNEGTQDLVIQKLVPGCGCTAAFSSPGPIKPGQTGTIHVDFDTTGFSGDKFKTVRIYSNDYDSDAAQVLTVKGFVQPDVTIEPMLISFDEIVKGSPVEESAREVSVKVRDGSSIEIQSVKSFSPQLEVKILRSDKKQAKFTVGVLPSAPAGEIRDRVVVALKGGKESVISVPVYAHVRGKLALKPAQLSFGIIEGKDLITRSLKLDNASKDPVNVHGIKSQDPAVSAVVKTIQPGKLYVVQVTVDPQKVKKNLKTSIQITTDSADEPSMVLSVYGVLPPKVKK